MDARSRTHSYNAATRQSTNQPSTSTQNPQFFQGAYNTDASGTFNGVAGDQYNIHVHDPAVRTEREEIAILEKLPRAASVRHTSSNHKKCLEGTRTAVLAEIQRWEADVNDTFVYWLKGVAGCGKSTIAQTFAQLSSAGDRLGASFFCSRDFDDRRDLRLIFPTLAFYLALHDPSFRTALVPIILSNPDIRHDSLAVQFQKLIVGPLKATGLRPTIIIDALDECRDDEPVSEFLSALAQHLHEIPFIKIFITGRPEDHIRSGFAIRSLRTRELPLHDVDSATVDSDIELYVRTELQAIAERPNNSIRGPWPLENDISAIIKKCSSYFIIASVIIGFIDHPWDLPQDRLELIVGMANSTIYEGMSKMDVVYYQILVATFRRDGMGVSNPFDLFRLVVAPIVVAFNPLSRASLARMLGVSSERIWKILSHFHSVLIVPDSDAQPIRVCHKSFPDFLIDPERCRDPRFHVDAPVYHLDLGVRCLKLMNVTLKRNICDLPQYVMNKDVKDLLARREKYVEAALAYACEFWVDHLRSSAEFNGVTDAIIELVEHFLKNHFLSWLEVLSIEGTLRVSILSLRDIKSWPTYFTTWKPSSSVTNLIVDCERFVLQFFDIIEMSATHIYHSALPWSPTSSLTRKIYQMHLETEVELEGVIDMYWDSCIKTIPFPTSLRPMAFSHNGTSLAAASSDHVMIFDTITGGTTFKVHIELTHSAAFSLDDNMLMCCGLWNVSIWDVRTSNLVQRFLGREAMVSSAALSPCGTMIASGNHYDKMVRVWNVSSGCCQGMLEDYSKVSAVCWSGTGDQVISGSVDGTARVWDVSKWTCLTMLHEHTDRVLCIASLPGSCFAASASRDGTLKVYDLRSGDVLRTVSTEGVTGSIQFSNHGDNLTMTYTTLGSATIYDLTRDIHLRTINCHGGDNVVISRDGTLIASAHFSSGDSCVKIWSTENGHGHSNSELQVNQPFQGLPWTRISFAPDGKLMEYKSPDNLEIWNLTSGECIFEFPTKKGKFFTSAFSPDSAFYAFRPFTDAIQVLNIHTRSVDTKTKLDANTDFLTDTNLNVAFDYYAVIAVSPGGSRLVTLSNTGITLWNSRSSERLAHLDLDSSFSRRSRISFSVDGARVSIKRDDGDIWIWRICRSYYDSFFDGTPLSMLFRPVKKVSHKDGLDIPRPRQRCCYENHDEWVLDDNWRRILWIPPNRRMGTDSELV